MADGTAPRLPDPASLAGLDRNGLADAIRPLWEDAGWLADRLVGQAFASWREMVEAAAGEVEAATEAERASLLRAHPRLGAPKQALKERSALSFEEQGGARQMAAGDAERVARLNDEYEARFGFPFVEWVAGRPLEEMVGVMERRLGNDRRSEIEAGCRALVDIARDRLARMGG